MAKLIERFSDKVTRLMAAEKKETKPEPKEGKDAAEGETKEPSGEGKETQAPGKEKGAEGGEEKKPGEEKETPEPPAPKAKTEAELNQPPGAFLESEPDKKLGEQMGEKDGGAQERKEWPYSSDKPQHGIAERPASRSFADVSKELRGAGVASLSFHPGEAEKPEQAGATA